MAAQNEWHEVLSDAMRDDMPAMQLATLNPVTNAPRVRTLIHRGFLTASKVPKIPLILSTTDVRAPKVAQLAADRWVEVVYWIPRTKEQFRIVGLAHVVPAPGHRGEYPRREGPVCSALDAEGLDWEAKRMDVFDGMSGQLKASWCRPIPGTPLGPDGEEEMKKWPQTLPKLKDAEEADKKNLAMALSNFALLLIEPYEVDYVELGGELDRRTRFEKCWSEDGSVGFKATLLVP